MLFDICSYSDILFKDIFINKTKIIPLKKSTKKPIWIKIHFKNVDIIMPRINKDIIKHFKNWPEVDKKMKQKKLGVSFGYSQFIIIILSIYLTIYQPFLY